MRERSLLFASLFLLLPMFLLITSMDSHSRGFGSFPGGRGSQPSTQPNIDEVMKELTKKLRLNDGQAAEIRPILQRLFMQQNELRQTMTENGNRENMQTLKIQMQTLQQEAMGKMADFLNEEQLAGCQKALENIIQKNRDQRRPRENRFPRLSAAGEPGLVFRATGKEKINDEFKGSTHAERI